VHRPWTGGLRELVIRLWAVSLILVAAVAADRVWLRLVAGSGERAARLQSDARAVIAAVAIALIAREVFKFHGEARRWCTRRREATRSPPGPQGHDGPDIYDV
jgi:hypothetical protein